MEITDMATATIWIMAGICTTPDSSGETIQCGTDTGITRINATDKLTTTMDIMKDPVRISLTEA